MSEVLLRGRELTRRWGGVVAVDRVSIELERGQVHALIGTNAVVTRDVEANHIVVGIPAKSVKTKDQNAAPAKLEQ